MSEELYADLAWLPKPPEDFRRRCKSLAESDEPGRAVSHLAGYALRENQLHLLADALERLSAAGTSLAPLTPFKLGLLGNATLEPLVPTLTATAPRFGISLECVRADFGQTIQEALTSSSRINSAKPDAVLLAFDYRGLPLGAGGFSEETMASAVNESIAFLRTLREGIRAHCGALSILQTLVPPPDTLFGHLDRVIPGTLRRMTAAFNTALVDSLRGTQDILLDVSALANTVGLAHWHSPTQWNIAKFPFDSALLPFYSDHVCRIVGALRGKSRRCLVLDLDNTLWGGIIGDDGLEGIVIGQGNATGEAHLEVQRTALALRNRGVVLAVSSKNADEVARKAFTDHPEMILREEHIAVFQANWSDKATNLSAIAAELALGIDSLVFLDDNPVERALIRQMLPQVAVPELPEDPALYARTLTAAGYFEAITFSEEDRRRAEFYQGNARRAALRQQVGDMESYLASLEMEIVFSPFDATGRSRITQLINKSNQFNLTTRRYTESEVAALENDPRIFTLQVRLIDSFGDNGMISVIVCHERSSSEWEIDTWLMSCRVLGRRVEHMVLREILLHARTRGVQRLIGRYIPSERNGMVREHYATLGFRRFEESPSGATAWELKTEAEIESAPMVVTRSGFDDSVPVPIPA
ncbi:MAG TPA: HAD-IIIC family phosphatase [Candidatus Baltobacteraceae bacterium]|jgi:FkbH-like protein|nr:HAD-IIIC family phosphatase [Candidatus Baltobacteraceae bacterium]